jgi:lipopolysaccharide export system permease protein
MFMPLFVIASVIFLIKLSSYTAVIQLSIWEMGKLYLFILPQIFFYTLPITFFIAATLSLFKLSNDNEIIVLFALGIKPGFIIKIFFKPALILTILLAFNFLIVSPHTTALSKNFLSYKRNAAKLNLAASEFGNRFGDWLLYIGAKNDDGTFSKVVLFNKKKKQEVLITANKAKIINDSGILRFKLINGKVYNYSTEKFTQINFKMMLINNTLKTDFTPYKQPLQYWLSKENADGKRYVLIRNTLISLFPIVTLFLVTVIGIRQARHQKSNVYLYIFLSVVFYYGIITALNKIFHYYTIPIVLLLWLLVTYILYRKNVANKF